MLVSDTTKPSLRTMQIQVLLFLAALFTVALVKKHFRYDSPNFSLTVFGQLV